MAKPSSYALDDNRPLRVQLIGVSGMGFLLAVLQSAAAMGLQHAVLGTEVAVAKAAVADDALGRLLALLETASGLAGGHGVGSWRLEGLNEGIGA